MVRLSCEAVCVSGNSTILCELLLNHTCFGKTLFVGQNVLVKVEDREENFQCLISRSLPCEDMSRITASHSIIGKYSGSLIVHIIELGCAVYSIPSAKTVVLSSHPNLRNVFSPSLLKRHLHDRIITQNQSISHPGGAGTLLIIKTVHGRNTNNVQAPDQMTQFFKICRRTQIIVEFDVNEACEMDAPELTAESDVFSSINGLINRHLTNTEYISNKKYNRTQAIHSVLLEGRGRHTKSLIVQKVASSAKVSVQKIMPTALVYFDHKNISQILSSLFISVFLREPCILLIESLEILKGLGVMSELNLIVKKMKWFLKILSGLNHSLLPVSSSPLLPKRIKLPRVMVFACAESIERIDFSLKNSFTEKISVSDMEVGDCNYAENITKNDIMQQGQDMKCSRPCRSFQDGNECKSVNIPRTLKSSKSSNVANSYVLSHVDILAAIQDVLLIPQFFSSVFREYSIPPPTGIILYGPSGTGKTMLVKSIIGKAGVSFMNIKLSNVISGSVGEASNVIRRLFVTAKQQSPTVVFIDEFQALFSSRDGGIHASSKSCDSSLLYTLIGCLDDISLWNSCAGPGSIVTVIAATNEPWAVDEVLLRSGRFDKLVLIGTMSHPSRQEILKKMLSGLNGDIPVDVDTHDLASNTEGFTGADMNILFQKSCHLYAEQHEAKDLSVNTNLSVLDSTYFEKVLETMESSCSDAALMDYANWGRDFQTRVW